MRGRFFGRTAIGVAVGFVMAGFSVPGSGASAAALTLYDGGDAPRIVYEDTPTARLAADMVSRDIAARIGKPVPTTHILSECRKVCILLATRDAPRLAALAAEAGLRTDDFAGFERYGRIGFTAAGTHYLAIVGADRRGMIYGAVDLSRALGINAWQWWADVPPRPAHRLTVATDRYISASPAVRFRGIFLNDEDWGLNPWAAHTFEPGTPALGPKTYARIFELMWRLKANTIWPAMHDVSAPFFGNPANVKTAEDYAIVVGSSHAEPMLRNNVREWDEKTRGPFNFLTNRQAVTEYWRTRIADTRTLDGIYTVGMRGIHDSPMLGADTPAARKAAVEDVIGVQRTLLTDILGKPADTVPQVFPVYKEVADIYNAGLSLPDDVTIMWCDDNYGYLTRLSTPDEQTRPGGAGVYYHISYWGVPHDYLWLATTHPGLIREEMDRAWATQARKIWIVNVGDIKPGEYLTQYFLDLAFDHATFERTPREHLRAWLADIFGPQLAPEIADIQMRYYDLAWPRRPEFMGFGQLERQPIVRTSAYAAGDGEEAQARLAAYAALRAHAEAIADKIPEDRRAAYFELVLYPVRSAANLNARILDLDLAELYARQGRASAPFYVERAKTAQDAIVADTTRYNTLSNGKWNRMMDMAPRRLPVFDTPAYPRWPAASSAGKSGCGIGFAGQYVGDGETMTFRKGVPEEQHLALYAFDPSDKVWSAKAVGLTLSSAGGSLAAQGGYETRIDIRYDGLSDGARLELQCAGKTRVVAVKILPPGTVAIERYRRVRLKASDAIVHEGAKGTPPSGWEILTDLGSMQTSMRRRLDGAGDNPLRFDFETRTAAGGRLKLVGLPTHPLAPADGVHVSLSLDGGAPQSFDLGSIVRSDVWRDNVLSNTATAVLPFKMLPAGRHTLVLSAAPGTIVDRIDITLDGASPDYGVMPPP